MIELWATQQLKVMGSDIMKSRETYQLQVIGVQHDRSRETAIASDGGMI